MGSPEGKENTLGERIRAIREARGWSPEAMAKELFRATGYSVTARTIENYESGESRRIDVKFFLALVRLTGLSLECVISMDELPKNVVPIKPAECPHCSSIREKLGPEKWAALLQLAETMSGGASAMGPSPARAHQSRKAGAGR